jgi:hypothetical protein
MNFMLFHIPVSILFCFFTLEIIIFMKIVWWKKKKSVLLHHKSIISQTNENDLFPKQAIMSL